MAITTKKCILDYDQNGLVQLTTYSGGTFIIQHIQINSAQFISEFNQDGDPNSQADNEVNKETLDKTIFNHIIVRTAIGLDWHFLIPDDTLTHPFIIKYDQANPIQNIILGTLTID